MKKQILLHHTIIILGLLAGLQYAKLKAQTTPPNIVFILADDLGYGDLACYGHREIKTPNIDQLAKEGIQLTAFYAASPLCSPSRAGFLTGRTPFRSGIESWIPEGQNIYLHKQEITLAELLKQAGYQTFLAGKWHLNGSLSDKNHPQPDEHGFDQWMANHAFAIPTHKDPSNFFRNGKALGVIKGYSAQIVMDESIQWLEKRSEDRPFFMFLPLNEPHSEIASPDLFNLMYSEFTEGKIDLENLQNRGPGEYYANITHIDYQVGRILKKLNELQLRQNTIVIFTSDNGPVTTEWRYWWEVNMYGSSGGLRGRKADLFEGGIRVPCIIRYPSIIEAATKSNVPIHAYDFLPTICSMLGLSTPTDRVIDGIDISPIFEGKDIRRSQPLFWAYETRADDKPGGYHFAVRDANWKMITDRGITKTLLYNLKDDPYEVRELSKQYPEKVAALAKSIRAFQESILNDPLRPK